MNFGYNEYLPSQYHVVTCEACGFCYSDSIAKIEDYDKYYTNCNTYSDEQKEQRWLKKLYSETKKFLLKNVKLDTKIMDMGFGKGELLCYLKENGFSNLYGVDPSAESVTHLEQMGISGEIGGTYENGKEKFGVVMLFNVLEHLFEPRLAIENLRKPKKKGN